MLVIHSKFLFFWCSHAGNCVHFVIDVLHETLILFENAIEIYGDIQGADNSFKIQAYEQGKRTDVEYTIMC